MVGKDVHVVHVELINVSLFLFLFSFSRKKEEMKMKKVDKKTEKEKKKKKMKQKKMEKEWEQKMGKKYTPSLRLSVLDLRESNQTKSKEKGGV